MKKSILLTIVFALMLSGFLTAAPILGDSPLGGTVIIIQGFEGNQTFAVDTGFSKDFSKKESTTLIKVIDSNERTVFQKFTSSNEMVKIDGLASGRYKLVVVSNDFTTEQSFWVNYQ